MTREELEEVRRRCTRRESILNGTGPRVWEYCGSGTVVGWYGPGRDGLHGK